MTEIREGLINIKIKTLNSSIYEIIVNPFKPIITFQSLIEQVRDK
jgi:hypothetical protein